MRCLVAMARKERICMCLDSQLLSFVDANPCDVSLSLIFSLKLLWFAQNVHLRMHTSSCAHLDFVVNFSSLTTMSKIQFHVTLDIAQWLEWNRRRCKNKTEKFIQFHAHFQRQVFQTKFYLLSVASSGKRSFGDKDKMKANKVPKFSFFFVFS